MRDPEERAEVVVPEEVNRLLDERSQVEGWLERLAELEDEATPEVYARVESDYRGRLGEVNGRLSSHRADLEGSLAAQRERVSSLQEDRDERAAELEEAKLRFSVGEYDDEEWDRRREAAQGAIAELDGRLEEARAALEEVEGVLAALPGGEAADVWRSSAAEAAESAQSAPAESREARSTEVERTAGPEMEGPDTAVAETEAPTAETETEEAVARGSQSWLADLADPADAPSETAAEAAGPDQESAELESRTASPDAAEARAVDRPGADASDRREPAEATSSDDDFLDELEFLESLSLDDSKRFDAVSAMLEGEEEAEEGDGREGRG